MMMHIVLGMMILMSIIESIKQSYTFDVFQNMLGHSSMKNRQTQNYYLLSLESI
jgi:hypothetical protein